MKDMVKAEAARKLEKNPAAAVEKLQYCS